MVKKLTLSCLIALIYAFNSFAFEHENLDDVIQNGKFAYIIPILAPTEADHPPVPIGSIEVYDSKFGLILVPKLSKIPPGVHGFHIHESPNCNPLKKEDSSIITFGQAGGHYDPEKTDKHLGPYGRGHLGDLPALIIPENSEVALPILAPRLTSKDILNHSIIIHEQADNYSDFPKKLGGGGKRIACGIIIKN